MATKFHSPITAFRPRSKNDLNFITFLIIPKTGSTVDFRFPSGLTHNAESSL